MDPLDETTVQVNEGENVIEEVMDFEQFDLDPAVIKSLNEMGFKKPTAIQAEAIPLVQSRVDVIGLAQTGSGKTAACAIPICDHVDPSKKSVQALIVVPTRELALQYATETGRIGKHKGVVTFAIYGGEDYTLQQSKLKQGVQVLVCTPGRLIDHIYQRTIDLSHVEMLVLDEADEMLSMGFIDDLDFIVQCLVHEHQTMLFSATMSKEIKEIAKKYMKDPQEIVLSKKDVSTPSSIDHAFLFCRHDQRDETLIEQIKSLNPKQAIIFCHSRIQVEKVCRALKSKLDKVDYLHAGLSQSLRTSITSKFRSGRVRLLVATDVAARGLDFSDVTHVFIYQLSDDPDVFVHRSGRTGRQDRAGEVITLVTGKELHLLNRVLERIKKDVKWIGDPPPAKLPGSGRSGHRPSGGRPSGGRPSGRKPHKPK